jgi:hypothetical protein
MSLPLSYTTTGVSGTGEVCDLSHDGIAFSTANRLPVGAHVKLSITLPVQSNGSPVRLDLSGEIVRSEAGSAAARISSRAFRSAMQQFMAAGA